MESSINAPSSANFLSHKNDSDRISIMRRRPEPRGVDRSLSLMNEAQLSVNVLNEDNSEDIGGTGKNDTTTYTPQRPHPQSKMSSLQLPSHTQVRHYRNPSADMNTSGGAAFMATSPIASKMSILSPSAINTTSLAETQRRQRLSSRSSTRSPSHSPALTRASHSNAQFDETSSSLRQLILDKERELDELIAYRQEQLFEQHQTMELSATDKLRHELDTSLEIINNKDMQLNALDKTILKFERDAAQKDTYIDELNRKVEQLNASVELRESTIVALQATIKNTAAETEQRIKQMNNEHEIVVQHLHDTYHKQQDELLVRLEEQERAITEQRRETDHILQQYESAFADKKLTYSDREKSYLEQISTAAANALAAERIMNDLRQEKDALNVNIVKLRAEKLDLEKRFEQFAAQAEQRVRELNTNQAQLEIHIAELEKQKTTILANYETKVEELVLSLQEVEQQLTDMQHKHNKDLRRQSDALHYTNQAERNALEHQFQTMIDGIKQQNGILIQSLEQDVHEQKAAAAAAEIKVQQLEAQLQAAASAAQHESIAHSSEMKALKSELLAASSEVSRLQESFEQLSKTLEQRETDAGKQIIELAQSKKREKDLNQRLLEQRDKYKKDLEERSNTHRDTVNEMSEKIRKLEKMLQEKTLALNAQVLHANDLENFANVLKQANDSINNKVKALEQQKQADAARMLSEFSNQLGEVRSELGNLARANTPQPVDGEKQILVRAAGPPSSPTGSNLRGLFSNTTSITGR